MSDDDGGEVELCWEAIIKKNFIKNFEFYISRYPLYAYYQRTVCIIVVGQLDNIFCKNLLDFW